MLIRLQDIWIIPVTLIAVIAAAALIKSNNSKAGYLFILPVVVIAVTSILIAEVYGRSRALIHIVLVIALISAVFIVLTLREPEP